MEEIKLSTKLEYPQINEIFKNWKIMSTWGKERLIYENESKKNYFIIYTFSYM